MPKNYCLLDYYCNNRRYFYFIFIPTKKYYCSNTQVINENSRRGSPRLGIFCIFEKCDMTSINSSSPNCFISKMKADNSNLDTNNSTRFKMKKLLSWLWGKKLLCCLVLIALILVGIIFGLTTNESKDGKFVWTFLSKNSHCFFMLRLRTKALCFKKFQNVKLRLDFVEIW